ncbi:MAG: hypothetical protein WC455_29185 [Dehalococcoidia bacterium]|jgi:hypothetical protein
MKPWNTEDDCVVCGHSGMVFIPQRVDPAMDLYGDSTFEVWGILSCPACGSWDVSVATEDMVPASEIGLVE